METEMTHPTTESLLTENARLRADIRDTRIIARDRADLVESYDTAAQGPEAVAKEMARLNGMLRTVQVTRDQWATTVGELQRERAWLSRRLAQCERNRTQPNA